MITGKPRELNFTKFPNQSPLVELQSALQDPRGRSLFSIIHADRQTDPDTLLQLSGSMAIAQEGLLGKTLAGQAVRELFAVIRVAGERKQAVGAAVIGAIQTQSGLEITCFGMGTLRIGHDNRMAPPTSFAEAVVTTRVLPPHAGAELSVLAQRDVALNTGGLYGLATLTIPAQKL